ncbi:MAG: hypothetical protein R3B90_14715 [Planctomycetaceae bacterium]
MSREPSSHHNSSTAPSEPAHAHRPHAARASASRLERGVLRQLSQLRGGRITLRLPSSGEHEVGYPDGDDLRATVTVHDRRFFRELAFGGSLGAAEAYLQGLWETDDLVTLIRIFCRNLDQPDAIDGLWSRVALAAARMMHWVARNSRRGARRNIARTTTSATSSSSCSSTRR